MILLTNITAKYHLDLRYQTLISWRYLTAVVRIWELRTIAWLNVNKDTRVLQLTHLYLLKPHHQPDSTMKLWRRSRTNPTSSDQWGGAPQPREGSSADPTVTANRTSARYLPGGSPWDTTTSRRTTSASRASTVWGKSIQRWKNSSPFSLFPVLSGATTGTTQRTIFPRNRTGSM